MLPLINYTINEHNTKVFVWVVGGICIVGCAYNGCIDVYDSKLGGGGYMFKSIRIVYILQVYSDDYC